MPNNHALLAPQAKEAARLYAQGLSTAQIGERFGVSRQAVGNALVALGVRLRTQQQGRQARLAQVVQTTARAWLEGAA